MSIPPNNSFRTMSINIQKPVYTGNPDEPFVLQSSIYDIHIPTSGNSEDTVQISGNIQGGKPKEKPSSSSHTIEFRKAESPEGKNRLDILTDSMVDKLRTIVGSKFGDKLIGVFAKMLKVTKEELLERINQKIDEVSEEEPAETTEETEETTEETEEEPAQEKPETSAEEPTEAKDTKTRLLERIAELLGISVEELLERSKSKPKEEPKEPSEPTEAKDTKTRLLERIAQLREKNVEDSKEKDKPEEKTAEKPEESSWTSRLYEAI